MSLKYRTGQGTSASDFTDLVVKVGDTLPIGTEVDYDGQTAPAGWQEVDDPNVYSTTEKRIGTWIDGKPLYRKIYTGVLTDETTSYNYAQFYLPTTIDTLVRLNGTMKTNNSNAHYVKPFPAAAIDINYFYNEGTGRTRLYGLTKNEMVITSTSFIAIAEYTKTTD